ncbi:MAG: hypothetical protein L3J88_13080 [Gammaproteobacteria bacterium]|nr:hypothetical protein [Gammaproteobacteria bacterium]MCF6364248.1 hypothetical protein [Gammaproteobacteria bacterium]
MSSVITVTPNPAVSGNTHTQLRVFQVFVNVEGIKMRKRGIMRFISLLSRKEYGFYAVMLVAAEEDSMPPFLLSLVNGTLIDEFSLLSHTPPESWQIQLVDWRMVGMAPPMFQQHGCVDSNWGAAWYDMADESAKKHRYRLTKLRLWKGKRARLNRPPKKTTGRSSPSGQAANT